MQNNINFFEYLVSKFTKYKVILKQLQQLKINVEK